MGQLILEPKHRPEVDVIGNLAEGVRTIVHGLKSIFATKEKVEVVKDRLDGLKYKEREILIASWDKLDKLVYEQYEISNFAKKGCRCIHNQVYWNLGQYIGLGPSAESSVGYKKVISLREKDSVEEYIKTPSFDAYKLSKEELEEEYLLTHLRLKDGINKEDYFDRFSRSFDDVYNSFIENLEEGLYTNDEKCFKLTKEGFLVENQVILTLAMAI